MRLRYHHAVLCVCLLAASAPVEAQKKDDAPPEPAVAPFDAKKAEEHQKAWAKHLGVRVKLRNSIGILDHRNDTGTESALKENLEGLAKIVK